jgi:uncharacterized protein YqgV (UPF0045/DUF77 family)
MVTKPPDDEATPPAAPAINNSPKTGGGKFKVGKSGNGAGRPKGSRNRKTMLLEAMTQEDRAAIVDKIIRQAKRGCRVSQRLIADRIEPVRKARVKFRLRPIATVDDVVAAFADIAAAVASGVLTLDEAAAASIHIDKVRDGIVTRDLAQKIAALEGRLQQP